VRKVPAQAGPAGSDDSLALLFGCCHLELSAPSQVALTLRAIGGLSTAQIAAAFGVPETTMAQAYLRELAGDLGAAAAGYLQAARRTTSVPERRYLAAQAARLDPAARPPAPS
jgi:hypothetical protein